ncbi:MAG: ADP-ribosyltransferase [Eubacteriales bacterium]|uniref:VG15 protein n=1 Tax=Anaerococcus sp. TaxID=1872515 RepID=UPI002A920462|nr:ADP-ribosyltransferase [Anaerococcus sp.]MDD6920470.1 ADP-ribosyltransferase [Eubacteriales bacterium]MDY6127736.1 ADP-ribosyltransferase [Anaerococcus sp.]
MKNEEVKDLVPELFDKIDKTFKFKAKESKIIKDKLKVLKNKKASYKDANEFAVEVGNILADTFQDKIKTKDLPDGKMYYNIAKRLIEPNMVRNHYLVSEYSKEVQNILNKQANISIQSQKADLNQDRIDRLVDKITRYDSYEDGKWLLNEPIINFSQAVVDETIRKNADLHSKAGLSPKIERYTNGKCCDWCDKLAGIYNYEDVKNTGNEVFRRHRHCDCLVIYDPKNGKNKRIVHSAAKHKALDEKRDRIDLANKIVDNKLSNIARSKAMELGYNPLPDNKVVNTLRKDAKKWIQTLSEDEVKAIRKYTYNGKDEDGLRLFEKINGYLDNRYIPSNEKEEEIILTNAVNIEDGLLKNQLKHDIIVYRTEEDINRLNDDVKKFLSTSVTKKGAFGGKPNVAIIVPKDSNGAYIEPLAVGSYKKQREFLLNRGIKLVKVLNDNDINIFEVKNEIKTKK